MVKIWKRKETSSKSGSASTSSRLSSKEICAIIEDLKQHQHRDSTKKNYLAVWKIFNEFFVHLDFKPRDWEDRLNLFVGYLIQNDRKSATVKSYNNNVKIAEDRYLLSSLVKACRIKNDVVKT